MSILLTEQEVVEIAEEHGLCTMVTDAGYKNDALWFDGDKYDFARAIQLALIEKLSKEPVGHYCLDIAKFEEGTQEYHSKSEWEPLYRLPTPQELENES